MKRVLLYNPVSETFTMPLGLIAVGSQLPPEEYRVEIYDGRIDREAFFDAVARGDLLAVGVSVLTGRPIADALEVSRRVKSLRPEVPVIWGGWHPSIMPEQCLSLPFVDHVVIGQGERSFRALVERLHRGEPLDECRGIGFKSGGEPVLNAPRAMEDIRRFSPLRFDLIDVPSYFALKGKRQLDYYSSQGCPYQCTFCADPFVFGRQWKGLGSERIVSELIELHRRYGMDDVFFNDDLFFVDRERLEKTCDGLIDAGSPFTWVAAGRADLIKRYSDELMKKIRDSGCRRISIGAESGSQSMLNEVKKKLTVEDIYESAVRCHQYGIQLAFSFMTGFPSEDPSVLDDTLDLVKRIKKVNGDFDTPIFFYYAYPGTELTEQLRDMGVALPEDVEGWVDFDFYRGNTSWLARDTRRLVERANFYLRHAFRRPNRWWSAAGWLLFVSSRLRIELGFYRLALEMHLAGAWRRLADRAPSWDGGTVRAQIAFKLRNVCG